MTNTSEIATLVLCFDGRFQSYGVSSSTDYRETGRMPSNSAVIGIICRTMGLSFAGGTSCQSDNEIMNDLDLRFCVRDDSIGGRIFKDFQTACFNGEPKIRHKEVLLDKRFMVFLQGKVDIIKDVYYSLCYPQAIPYYGQKRYPFNSREVFFKLKDTELKKEEKPGLFIGRTIESLLVDERFDSNPDNPVPLILRPYELEVERDENRNREENKALEIYCKNHPSMFKGITISRELEQGKRTRPIEFSENPRYGKLLLKKFVPVVSDGFATNREVLHSIVTKMKKFKTGETAQQICLKKAPILNEDILLKYVGTYTDKKDTTHEVTLKVRLNNEDKICFEIFSEDATTELGNNLNAFYKWVSDNVKYNKTEHRVDRSVLESNEVLYKTTINMADYKSMNYHVRNRDYYKIHGALSSAFPKDKDAYLYFVDRQRLVVHMLSALKPDKQVLMKAFSLPVERVRTHETSFKFVEDQEFKFILNANPVVRHNRKDTIIKDEKGLNDWLVLKAHENGFELTGFEFSHDISIKGKNNGLNSVSLNSVSYYGTLKVTDAVKFHKAVVTGIGRSKSSGFGMMRIEQI